MIAIDLSKQQALNPDLKSVQQINFTGSLNRQYAEDKNINYNTTVLLIIEKLKETILKYCGCVPQCYFVLLKYQYKRT